MFRLTTISLLICFFMFVIGCSPTPKPASYSHNPQQKMQASRHWRVFAKDIGHSLSKNISDKKRQSVYIKTNNNSPFCRAFRSFIATDLVNSGVSINEDNKESYTLAWSVQSVKHDGPRKVDQSFFGENTLVASLGYGVYKVFEESTTASQFIATGVAADIVQEIYDTKNMKLPKNEVIINVTMTKSNDTVYRSSNIYYINDMDKNHYVTTVDNLGQEKEKSTEALHVIE